jgi:hypothetical protein
VIGSLRFVGILIISVWLGAAVFSFVGAGSAVRSAESERLLGARNHPYYSGALNNLIEQRLFYFASVCSAAALVHLAAVWLYLGRVPHKGWLALLAALALLNLALGLGVQPRLNQWHLTAHAVNVPPQVRERALESKARWSQVNTTLSLALIAGLTVYLWRAANQSDAPRFVSSVKFRS